MKGFLQVLPLLGLIALLTGGCGKKNADEGEGDVPPATPAEQTPAGTAMNGQPTNGAAAPNPQNGTVTAQPSGGMAELATTDVAYEAWFRKYALDLNDPNMLDADPDTDGYSNREEFLADTNPKDANSRPGVHTSIRLKEFTEVKVPFMLRSVEGETAKIEHEEGGERKVEAVHAGQPLRGSSYKVQRVEVVQTQDKDGNPIDASKVTLEDTATAQKVDLVKDLPARSSASYAVLTSADGTQSMTVRQGDTFNWPGETGATYRVVDLRTDQVILEQLENKKMWTIPKK